MFCAKLYEQYFLGANTTNGFCGEFTNNFNNEDGWRVYILKGGAGTGKSTLLKKAAEKLSSDGHRVTVCPCSADYNSLDAIIVQDKKLIILDGTAPHVVEPKYPGVSEIIVNLGEAFKKDGFLGNEAKIIELCKKNSTLHSFAARYMAAAGRLINNAYLGVLSALDTGKCESYSENLAKKYIAKKKNAQGKIWYRYLLSASCGKVVCLSDTLNFYQKVIPIADEFFVASSTILQRISAAALKAGYEVMCCKNPFLEPCLDAVFIPELSLAFCVKNRFYKFNTDSRIIHSERFLDSEKLKNQRAKINFAKKSADMLINHATSVIYQAKQVHDEIEKYYISAMDYAKLNQISDNLLEKL